MLRTQVLRRLDQLHANTLGIVSATRGDGKTLTAINLAIAIAADPARTALLVDFDLRSPSVHRRFHHEPVCGVEECLQRHTSVRDAMFKVAGYERLTILPAKSPSISRRSCWRRRAPASSLQSCARATRTAS